MKNEQRSWKLAGILLIIIAGVMLSVSVFLSFSGDIWYDELFTMGLINRPYRELIEIAARDVHPPLYYCVTKLLVDITTFFCHNAAPVIVAKLVSVFPFLLLLLVAVTKVRKHFGMFTAGLFAFLLLAMPNLADYTVEIRMYGWSMLFVTLLMLSAYELVLYWQSVKQPQQPYRVEKEEACGWLKVTAFAIGACYTHYFACVAAVMVYGYLLIVLLYDRHQKRRHSWYPFWISGVLCALCYVPWLSAVFLQVSQVSENYWILPLTWRSLGGCVKFLFKPAFTNEKLGILAAVVLFAGYCFVTGKAILLRTRNSGFMAGCLGVLGGLVAFGFTASFLLRPVFVYRYMLPAMGVFWLGFAVAFGQVAEKVQSKWYRWLSFAILFFYVMCGVRSYRAFYGEEMWKRVQMTQTMETLAQISPGDRLVFNFNQTQGVVGYYVENDTYLYESTPETLLTLMYQGLHDLEDDGAAVLPKEQIQNWLAQGETVWFIGSGNAREDILSDWEQVGIHAEEKASCLLERYWFNLYNLHD